MKPTERSPKNTELLVLLLACAVLFALFSFGCSGSKKPEAKDPAPEKPSVQLPAVPMEEKAERYGIVFSSIPAREDSGLLYKEPGNYKSPVTGKVKIGDRIRILDEKDFHVLVETDDKQKGWFLKRNVAELFFTEPEDKKEGKQPLVPDALSLFQMAFEENEYEPAIWVEVSPAKDMDLYEFPHEKSRVLATAKANHRYLITDTAVTGYPKRSYREFPNGAKGSHIVAETFDASYFYHEGKVFRAGPSSAYKAYSGFKKIEGFDPDFKNNKEKYQTRWIRLQTEDGTEGWTRTYDYFTEEKEKLWNRAYFFAVRGGLDLNKYLHVKEHPIKLLSRGARKELHAAAGKESEIISEHESYDFIRKRVKVLEEKEGWSKIQSYRNGSTAWVESKYLMDYRQAYADNIEKSRTFVQRLIKEKGTGFFSDFTLKEFPKEGEMPKLAVEGEPGVIVATEVRMRKSWSTDSDILGYFNKGEKVTILHTKEGWHKVKRSDGSVGWVSGQFCKVEK
ncbi:MAG: SH3 domain-containing protein [Acidaminococcaceae bacterium]|nr:SH3 domain-containing protein [Acidaminococcaceae bacterium]